MKNHEIARSLLIPAKGHTSKLKLAAERLMTQPEQELSQQYLDACILEAHILHADDMEKACSLWRRGLPRPVFDDSDSASTNASDDRATAQGYTLSCYNMAATGENLRLIYEHLSNGLFEWDLTENVKAELEKVLLTIIDENQLEVIRDKKERESVLNPMMESFKSLGLVEIKPTNLEKRIITGTLRRIEDEDIGSFKVRALNVSKALITEFSLATEQTEIKKPEVIQEKGLFFVEQNREVTDPMNKKKKIVEPSAYIFYLSLPVDKNKG